MQIEEKVPLHDLTTLRVGGQARFFARVQTVEELVEALHWAREGDMPILYLGGGSNLLIADRGFRGLVIHIAIEGRDYQVRRDGTVLAIAAAGESWDDLVAESVEHDLYGLENLSAIPGSVGATPIQNVGAYGVEVKDLIEFVEAIDIRTGQSRTFSNFDCSFSYRDSFFKSLEGRHYAVVGVGFRLQRGGEPNLSYKDVAQYFSVHSDLAPSAANVRNAIIEIRSRKFPDINETGTAGSFFKNPIITQAQYAELSERFESQYGPIPGFPAGEGMVKVPLAWILERLGWKGVTRGKVGTFANQPLVLVSHEGANAQDIMAFAKEIQQDVKEKTGVEIEPEVTIVE
jgi:UDP-N-acetylmuramate dehydrogenase